MLSLPFIETIKVTRAAAAGVHRRLCAAAFVANCCNDCTRMTDDGGGRDGGEVEQRNCIMDDVMKKYTDKT